MPRSKIVRPDRKCHVPVVGGVRKFPLVATNRKQAKNNAIKYGLLNYTIESFWESEYE